MLKTITTKDFLATNQLDISKPMFFDTEAEELYHNTSLMQLANETGEIYMVTTNTDIEVSLMIDFLRKCWLVGYNLAYDYGALVMTPKKTDDLFNAVKMAYPQLQQFTLDNVALFFDKSVYEGIEKKALQKKGFMRNAYLSQLQLRYASGDVAILRAMWKDDSIQKVIQTSMAYRLALYALEEVIVWQENGLPVLTDTLDKYIKDAKSREIKHMAELERLVGHQLNPRSPKQVKEFFDTSSSDKATLTRIAIEGAIVKATANGNRIQDRKAQEFTATQQQVAELVLSARKAKNDLSKLQKYVGHEKMYGRFKPIGTSTSRWSCSGVPKGAVRQELFNAQNYSRDFKAVFGVKADSGDIIVAADYATIEIRIAACMMGEENMYKALMDGVDIHKATASLLFDKPASEVTGKERSNAKVSNFGLAA